jgi:hypothetical protein
MMCSPNPDMIRLVELEMVREHHRSRRGLRLAPRPPRR